MKKTGKNKLTALWYSHPRLSIALLLIVVNLAVILLFTGILSMVRQNGFFDELAYIFTFTMSADGLYDFVNSQEDIVCFILKMALALLQMIIFSGALIGFTTDLLQSAIDKSLNTVGKIDLEDHYVFLNWSSIGPRVIYDLSFLEGNKNIVILSEQPREEVLNSIQNVFTENRQKMKNIRLFIKEGDPMSSKHLMDVSLDKAKYIGVLLAGLDNVSEGGMTTNDLNSLKTLFTMMNVGTNANIVLEAEENATLEKIEKLLCAIDSDLSKRIVVFSHDAVVGNIMGKAIVNPTFNEVYHELLSYDGVEFYGIEAQEVESALYRYNDCIPIINYDDDDEVDENGVKTPDQLYVLSDNAQTLGERGEATKFVRPLPYEENLQTDTFEVFIFSKEGSDEFVIDELKKYTTACHLDVKCHSYCYGDDLEAIKQEIASTQGKKKIMLLSADGATAVMQDAEVFLTAMDLRMSGIGKDVEIYTEICNPSNLQAMQNLGVASVIVSNKIISLFMVQLLTHPKSKKFYRDLISDNGEGDADVMDVDIRLAKELLSFADGPLTFSCQSELVQSFYLASGKKKMCIGFKAQGAETTRYLCDGMDKKEEILLRPDDQLILITY